MPGYCVGGAFWIWIPSGVLMMSLHALHGVTMCAAGVLGCVWSLGVALEHHPGDVWAVGVFMVF